MAACLTRSKLDTLLAYQQAGMSLIPIRPGGKEPLAELLPHGDNGATWAPFRDRPATEAEIKAWLNHDRRLNVAAITGRPSGGLVIADVDRPEKANFTRPPTPTVLTRGRGRHHFHYHLFGDVGGHRLPWGELLADGQYALLPPSEVDGRQYEWAESLSLFDIERAPLPGDLLRDRKNRSKKQYEDEGETVARNNFTKESNYSCYGSFPEKLLHNPAVALAVLQLCGRKVDRLGRAFLCPLPGHHERHPSAALYQEEGRPVVLHDFHAAGTAFEWRPLVDVYAAVKTGDDRILNSGERAVWWLRALAEADFIEPPTMVSAKLPDDAPKAALRLYQGFADLLALRTFHDQSQTASPFTWRFAGAWCGITRPATVGDGMKWLLTHGFLRQVPGGGKLLLYTLGRGDG